MRMKMKRKFLFIVKIDNDKNAKTSVFDFNDNLKNYVLGK